MIRLMNPATHRDQLVGMLTEAAEIEHCLMCTYLYGAFSLKQDEDEQLTAEEVKAVLRWRGEIIRIATDEMLHLALVSNLLISLGARPHYRRFNFPISPGLFPADVAVGLMPLDEATLDHFVYLERPRDSNEHDSTNLEKAQYIRRPVANRIMPFSDDYATVGDLYQTIEQSFIDLSASMGEKALFVGEPDGQITTSIFNLKGLCRITNLKEACAAIELIIHQGEGSRAANADSHYARFCAIREQWKTLKNKRAAFNPTRNAARNPVMRSPISSDRVQVTAEPASTLLDLGNACYGLMLPNGRTTLASQTLMLMHVATDIGNALTKLPANPEHPGITAGLTFSVSRQVLSFQSVYSGAALIAEKYSVIEKRLTELSQTPLLARYVAAMTKACDEWQAVADKTAQTALSPNIMNHLDQPSNIKPVLEPASAMNSEPFDAIAVSPKVDIAHGKDATIRFDHSRCIHARHCVLGEPEVFIANKPGEWIYPDSATLERIAIVANNCPSGAITYIRRDGAQGEVAPNVNVARIRENGPIAFHADLKIDGAVEGSCTTRATLCRCGQSKNKPYCDGAHNEAKFEASGESITQLSEPLKIRNGPLSIVPLRNGPLEIDGNLELCSGTGRTVNRLPAGAAIRLCRCGQSANKPYCDGTHAFVGFEASGV
jgi:CDGSH-type Zn-finger protein/uncharacterized Fe-S cluster protein YjdI